MYVFLGFAAILMFLGFLEPPTKQSETVWVRCVMLVLSLALGVASVLLLYYPPGS